jgi:hypothetical protein
MFRSFLVVQIFLCCYLGPFALVLKSSCVVQMLLHCCLHFLFILELHYTSFCIPIFYMKKGSVSELFWPL